jgi:hypothetical protein
MHWLQTEASWRGATKAIAVLKIESRVVASQFSKRSRPTSLVLKIKAGAYACKFDANGNPTECGAISVNNATGEVTVAVIQ